MAKIEITKTELVWPGKYNEDGTLKEVPRVTLPFQVIESVNESRATRETQKAASLGLFKTYDGKEGDTHVEGWKNKLIWGDNLLVMSSLLGKFSGKVDLIYIDPPFATGADFSVTTEIGDEDEKVTKEPSSIEEKAYRDTWAAGTASFLDMLAARLTLARELLSPVGSIYIHMDPTIGHATKLVADEIFGAASFQREIVWRIGWLSGYKTKAQNWIRNHDVIYYYVKDPKSFTFNKAYVPYPDGYVRRDGAEPTGKGTPIEDVWNANESEFALKGGESLDSIQIKSFSNEKTGYPTQKNESLLRRIIEASSKPNDLVLDFFCGSGTTLAVAEKLGRRWIGCDLGRFAVHTTRKRLLEINECKGFEVLNLGRYERQYWQGVTFSDHKKKQPQEQALYEYLAFVLKLYGAQPVAGMVHLHGKKGKAMLHIGAVDAPVTITEIDAAVEECAKAKQSELHVLGWEWEMGLYDLVVDAAKKRNVKLLLLQIPREVMEQQAAAKGDVRFFELAYLEMDAKAVKPREYRIDLKKFVIPNTELIPEEVRAKVTKWSDYIDYWAVDWDFQNDTFMQGWVAYRTKQQRKLPLSSDSHVYAKPGKYQVLVKVIDIFGNDTTQAVEINVK